MILTVVLLAVSAKGGGQRDKDAPNRLKAILRPITLGKKTCLLFGHSWFSNNSLFLRHLSKALS